LTHLGAAPIIGRGMAIPAGRKIAPATAPAAPDLLAVLVERKVLSLEQADKVRRAQRINNVPAEQAVQALGLANDVQVAQAVADFVGLPFVKINPLDLDLEVVTKAIPGPFAKAHGIVAIAKTAERITVAVHNPFAPFPAEDIKRVTGLDVQRVVATRNDVEAVSKGFYGLKRSLQHAEKELKETRFAGPDLGNLEQLSSSPTDLNPEAGPVTKALDHLLDYAFDQRASDIHFEPKRDRTLVRLRIDGVLHDQHTIPKIVYEAVVSRIKLLAGANLAEKRRPQDGRIKREWWVEGSSYVRTAGKSTTVAEQTPGTSPFGPVSAGDTILAVDRASEEQRRTVVAKASDGSITVDRPLSLTGSGGHAFHWLKNEVELRVSTMPTAFGEKAVLRIFDPDILLKGIDELGLSPHDAPKFQDFISRPTGIILVTGPTGSGKTTTLYSVLKHLSKPEVNILTIEDPIEMVFEDFNQVQVRPVLDVTFASALRTALRQDPDIIMVGEIRDPETAENAVQAALTGHLVLSTLHTNDAPSSITRLLDLGVPHFLITSTLIGVVAQRLLRQNCPYCTEEYAPTEAEAAAMKIPFEKLKPYRFRKGAGCLRCRDTGYMGRTGIYEILPMTEKIRRLVSQQAGSLEIFKAAREEGLRTLKEAAIEKVFRGTTTVTEMVRVTGK
jgi:type II secretory ATPase GspE/PulE/Tfp pilus assembly ATPase PilB-like protein